jgi:hypothetical protein
MCKSVSDVCPIPHFSNSSREDSSNDARRYADMEKVPTVRAFNAGGMQHA